MYLDIWGGFVESRADHEDRFMVAQPLDDGLGVSVEGSSSEFDKGEYPPACKKNHSDLMRALRQQEAWWVE